jgi:hypothetical protein
VNPIAQPVWICPNCKTQIETKHLHCWNCGLKRSAAAVKAPPRTADDSVPHFGSYEELTHEPARPSFMWRRGPLFRLFWFMVAVVFVGLMKVFESPWMQTYGLYIVGGVGLVLLLGILWRFFRRDKAEGVGINLH